MICYDHRGRRFKSIKEMCKAYDVIISTYYSRLRSGYSLEEALEKPNKLIMDNKGNEFDTFEEMCNYHGMCSRTYYRLHKKGKTMTEIFNDKHIIIDKYGNRFKSVNQFCNFYGIRHSQYQYHISKGRTVDDIVNIVEARRYAHINKIEPVLQKSGKRIEFEDKQFDSIKSLCHAYNVKLNTFYRRKERGFTLEECIYGRHKKSNDDQHKSKHIVYDHLGNEFKNTYDMCEHYGVNFSTFRARKRKGLPLDKCLSSNRSHEYGTRLEIFYMGKTYPSLKKLCDSYNINYHNFYSYRQNHRLSLKEALDSYIELKKRKNEGYSKK